MIEPLIVAGGLLVVAGGLALDTHLRYPEVSPSELESWAVRVQERLPAALATQATRGSRTDAPRIVRRSPVPGGYAWTLDLPGDSLAEDWDASRIVGALNSGGRLAEVGEMRSASPGWASLQVWPKDPLAGPVDIPWSPGELAPCCDVGTVCMGLQRNGKHVHFDMVNDVGGMASLFAGRRGSGKSQAMRLALLQMVAWGNVAPVVVDLVRNGVDYADLEPLLAWPVITDTRTAKAAIQAYRTICDERSKEVRRQGLKKVPRYTRTTPLLPFVVDEVQSIVADKDLELEVTRYTQETRPMGGVTLIATQYPHKDNLNTTLRAQMTNVWAGRLRNATESTVTLGSLPDGVAPHLLRLGPGGAVCDVDGPDLLTMRGWREPDGWGAAHVGAVMGRLLHHGP